MSGPVRYAAAQAGTRAGLGELLPRGMWTRLLDAGDSEQVVTLLSGTVYRHVLAGTERSPETLARRIKAHLVRQLYRPVKFLNGAAHDVLAWSWRRYELWNLRMLIRGIHSGAEPPDIHRAVIPMPASPVDWRSLSGNRSIPALIEALEKSAHGALYAGAMQDALHAYRRWENPFFLETAASLAVYRKLRRLINALSGNDAKDARAFLGFELDITNLIWAYRYRIYFDFDPEDILSYTLPNGFRVTAAVVQQIATGAPLIETVISVWGQELPSIQESFQDAPKENLHRIEILLRRHLQKKARQMVAGYPFRLGFLLAGNVLVENEVRDVIVLIEGKSAGWSREDVEQQLVGFGEVS